LFTDAMHVQQNQETSEHAILKGIAPTIEGLLRDLQRKSPIETPSKKQLGVSGPI
jgi:hypothetical protein